MSINDSLEAFHDRFLHEPMYYIVPFSITDTQNKPGQSKLYLPLGGDRLGTMGQMSVRLPVWYSGSSSLPSVYFAYTQLIYREGTKRPNNDYFIEAFVEQPLHWKTESGIRLSTVTIGALHQCNGEGNYNQRIWDRYFGKVKFNYQNWSLFLKIWHIIATKGLQHCNADIATYQGYGEILLQYQNHRHQVNLSWRHRNSWKFQYSFPLNTSLKGVIQYFNGYGPHLLSYNQRTQHIGFGVTLNYF